MLRLGHIDYSNCVPVHARLLEDPGAAGVRLVRGVPSELNAALRAGAVDVAPCSSIEYARRAPAYRLIPDFAIASDGPVGSILLESDRPPAELDGAEVAVPTASATSVVLLRILLEKRWGVRARFRWYDQAVPEAAPAGVAGTLRIGDIALRRRSPGEPLDLGAAWTEWTGLPFVFAVWQVAAGPERDPELARLHARLTDSLAYFRARAEPLAHRYAPELGLPADALLDYWLTLRYELDERALHGLRRFFRLAAEVGDVPAEPALRFTPSGLL